MTPINNKANRGVALTELMIGAIIAMMIIGSITWTYMLIQRYWNTGSKQISVQSRARVAMDKITAGIRPGYNAVVFDAGDRIQVDTDPNRTLSASSDDVTVQFRLNGTQIEYDPDISVSGDEIIIADGIYKITGENLFTLVGININIAFCCLDAENSDGYQGIDLISTVKLRSE